MAVTQVLTLTLVSQDPKTNSSQVRLLYKSTQTGGSYNTTDPAWRYTVTVNGAPVETVEGKSDLHKNTTDTLADRVLTVFHDDRGKAAVTVDTRMDTGISAGVVELTKTLELPDICRASAVSAGDGVIGSRATVVITGASGYTHSLRCRFGQLEFWVAPDGAAAAEEVIFSQRTVNLLLPETFYFQIPDSPAGTCVLTCTTYDGAGVIGSGDCSFTVTADPARCAPTITGSVYDCRPETVALTGDPGVLVREQSTARCAAEVTLGPGATVREIRVEGAVMEAGTLDIPNVSTDTFAFRVTDSRGYTGACRVQLPMIAYEELTLVTSVGRVDPATGTASVDIQGNWYPGSFGAADNFLTVTCRVNGGEPFSPEIEWMEASFYIASVRVTGLDYKSSHLVEVQVCDALQKLQRSLVVEPSTPVFDWGQRDFRFHVPVHMPQLVLDGVPLEDTVIDSGNNGETYWRKWSSGFAECWGRDHFLITAINTPWGGMYKADGVSLPFLYPVDFVYTPAEAVSVNANGRSHLLLTVRPNDAGGSGCYTLLCSEPEEGEDIITISYYAAGIWKDPTEGEFD